jgi:hypothetical protein
VVLIGLYPALQIPPTAGSRLEIKHESVCRRGTRWLSGGEKIFYGGGNEIRFFDWRRLGRQSTKKNRA